MLRKYFIYHLYYKYTGQRVFYWKNQFTKTQWLDTDAVNKKQFENLRSILKYSYNNIPYYKRRFDEAGIKPADIREEKDVIRIPTIQKKDIIENYNELFPAKYNGKTFIRETSGSSGSPLRLAKGVKSLSVMDAIMYRNYAWFGIDVGEKQGRYWGTPLSSFAKLKTQFKDYVLGRIRFSPFDISEKTCLDFYQQLRKYMPKFVYGYSQTVYRFAYLLDNVNIDLEELKLKAVITTGEMIYSHQLETIEKVFRCPVTNEYGCTELGIIAMQCPQKGMHLMTENLYIEFVKDNRHAVSGEEGEIVLTELFSDLVPLIRYKIGDIGIRSDNICTCGRGLPLLKEIKGRSDDFIICVNGKQVDPIVFEYILQGLPSSLGKISQFRILQINFATLEIEVCYEGKSFSRMCSELDSKLKNILGQEFEIKFHRKESLEADASGKLRCFISQLRR
jgi:phenylacetate-CoA ligase